MLIIKQIQDFQSLLFAKNIRYEVFCKEQFVSPEADWDNKDSFNYLAYYDNVPVGTMRWREVGKVIKLERLCVLKDYRNKHIARNILIKVLDDIEKYLNDRNKQQDKTTVTKLLLHAQLPVIPLYESLGFVKQGKIFLEEGIKHFTMIKEVNL
ncbi:MAG: GNAT family N-acetyltransferase [Bacteroidales bacterium]|nr:GNAT family N-acetyltransferase [Bacteroidales bacterium]